jgi:hypothetical protein
VLPRVGVRFKRGFGVGHLSMAIYALSEGLVLHDRFASPGSSLMDVNDEQWSLFSVALLGIIDAFTDAAP